MFALILKIIVRSIKLDSSLFKEKKLFGEAGIYFGIILILITSLITIIPNRTFLDWMSLSYNLGNISSPPLRYIILGSLISWFLKSIYLYFVGVVLFPNKNTKTDFRKILILVGYAHAPLFLNIFVINVYLLPLFLITYIWYNLSLIVGINSLLEYKSLLKSTVITLAPIIILLFYTVSQVLTMGQSTIFS